MSTATVLLEIHDRLLAHFGPQHWWPADSPFEVIVGAVLTQNTNWTNVEKAIEQLRTNGLLEFDALLDAPEPVVAALIRPSGYYNLKARRLRNLLAMFAQRYDGRIDALFAEDTAIARQRLLEVKGIGQETADSILLYAGQHPVFVVDAYTFRVCHRHQLVDEECDYQSLQELFMAHLEPDVGLFNEYHALLVAVGKQFCRKRNPRCSACPLEEV